jgi:hypothetical protein
MAQYRTLYFSWNKRCFNMIQMYIMLRSLTNSIPDNYEQVKESAEPNQQKNVRLIWQEPNTWLP